MGGGGRETGDGGRSQFLPGCPRKRVLKMWGLGNLSATLPVPAVGVCVLHTLPSTAWLKDSMLPTNPKTLVLLGALLTGPLSPVGK